MATDKPSPTTSFLGKVGCREGPHPSPLEQQSNPLSPKLAVRHKIPIAAPYQSIRGFACRLTHPQLFQSKVCWLKGSNRRGRHSGIQAPRANPESFHPTARIQRHASNTHTHTLSPLVLARSVPFSRSWTVFCCLLRCWLPVGRCKRGNIANNKKRMRSLSLQSKQPHRRCHVEMWHDAPS